MSSCEDHIDNRYLIVPIISCRTARSADAFAVIRRNHQSMNKVAMAAWC